MTIEKEKEVFIVLCAAVSDWLAVGNPNVSAYMIKFLDSINTLSNPEKEEVVKLKKLYDVYFEGVYTYDNYVKGLENSIPENYISKEEQLRFVAYTILSNFFEAKLFDSFYKYYTEMALDWPELDILIFDHIKKHKSQENFCAWLIGHGVFALAIKETTALNFENVIIAMDPSKTKDK